MVMYMDELLKNRASVSALADGQLQGADLVAAVAVTRADPDAHASWHAYHLVGDVLRSADWVQETGTSPSAFMASFQARLAAEPALTTVPNVLVLPVPPPLSVSIASPPYGEAANASVFRWRWAAGLASVCAVTAIAWGVLGSMGTGGMGSVATVAQGITSSTNPVSTSPMVMIRDPHLDALLAAHKQFGGTSALQAPAGFLRNATFEVSAK
jgi:sigma-E factor negative regulatory protein RseA